MSDARTAEAAAPIAATAAAPLVALQGATRRYGAVAALAGIDLEVASGEWLSVTGPSGSGKTTLLNLLAGLDVADGGAVRVAGEEISRLQGGELARYRRERVGLVFQEFHLIPYLNAVENVMLAQYVHSLADRAQAEAALARVGLGDRLRHRPSQLSGGEKQRVCIARALINHPPLLLADEPTGNLDADNEAQVLELFSALHRQGQTLVVVTHNPMVAGRGDRTVRLEHGRVVASQRPLDDAQALLLRLWGREEAGEAPAPRERERAAAQGWVDGEGRLSPEAHRRAAALVRRQRLAEVLLARTLEGREALPCGAVQPLQAGCEDEVAAFLGQPAACPHGAPIPPPAV